MSQHLIDTIAEQRDHAMNEWAKAEASRRVLAAEVDRLTALVNELQPPTGADHGTDAGR